MGRKFTIKNIVITKSITVEFEVPIYKEISQKGNKLRISNELPRSNI